MTIMELDVLLSLTVVDLLSSVKFLQKSCALKYCMEGTPTFLSSRPSLVYLAHVNCIYKSNVPFIDHENVI